MHQYQFHSPESAPVAAPHTFKKAQAVLGFVPNLYAGLANAPAAREAYFALSEFVDKSSLCTIERQVVLLATSVAYGCEIRVAAHSMIAKRRIGTLSHTAGY